jgi:hypothetical protein
MMLPSRVVVRTVIFLATVYCVWYLNCCRIAGVDVQPVPYGTTRYALSCLRL